MRGGRFYQIGGGTEDRGVKNIFITGAKKRISHTICSDMYMLWICANFFAANHLFITILSC